MLSKNRPIACGWVLVFAIPKRSRKLIDMCVRSRAHVEAFISGSIVLTAILLKGDGYGLIPVRFLCIFQINVKSIIAYSSVALITLVICGIRRNSYYGFVVSLIIILGHEFFSSVLFCLPNIVYEPGLSIFWNFVCYEIS
nr:uncharacterized protein LOC112211584 [Halyomorpha halys]